MSLPDDVIMSFFVLATNVPRSDLPEIEQQIEHSPMAAKKRLARTIVFEFHGESAAAEAEASFERTVQRKEIPDEIPAHTIVAGELLIDAIVAAGAAPSKREARRLFEQGAVSLEGTVISDVAIVASPGVVQVGKRRWLRLV